MRSSKPQGTARTKAIVKVLAKALVEASAKFKNVPSSDNGNELAFTARLTSALMLAIIEPEGFDKAISKPA